ncbi:MAG TPA: hypothetical protein DCS49_00075 [Gammaproteobacteria bacterium]|nr:hypothetical protein [Gammaproteobacteria bacterium]
MSNPLLSQLIAELETINSANVASHPTIPAIDDKITDAHSLLKALLDEGEQRQLGTAHMTSPVESTALIAQIVACLHQGNLLSPELFPLLKQIQTETFDWLCQQFDFRHVHLTAGSSYGNLEALWQAKQTSSRRTVYTSMGCHYSIGKACDMLDLSLVRLPCNAYEQIDLAALQHACQRTAPLAIIINAGTTISGALDPIADCLALAEQYQAWSHIDAAWGGGLILLPEYHEQFAHLVGRADSLCFDPHKAWSQPKPSSVLFYQQPPTATLLDTSYLMHPPTWQLQGSYGGEAILPLWLCLVTDSSAVWRDMWRYQCQQAARLVKALKASSFATPLPSQTGIVCFSSHCDFSPLIHNGILSRAQLNGKAVYRCIISHQGMSARKVMRQLQDYC